MTRILLTVKVCVVLFRLARRGKLPEALGILNRLAPDHPLMTPRHRVKLPHEP